MNSYEESQRLYREKITGVITEFGLSEIEYMALTCPNYAIDTIGEAWPTKFTAEQILIILQSKLETKMVTINLVLLQAQKTWHHGI